MDKIYTINANSNDYNNSTLILKVLKNDTVNKLTINVEEYNELFKCKTQIDNNKIWDKNKKKKNKYELVFISNRNKYINVSNYIPISRSYFKLWEILYDIDFFDIILKNDWAKITTNHIAEGPGGFIESTIRYCERFKIPIENINAITLKEDNNADVPNWKVGLKMINENNIKIHYGIDLTGNIYSIKNILDYIIKVGKNTSTIVTADGGIDYSIDYNKQEQLSYRLILCEIVIALSIQVKNGIFVFKIFDLSTQFTVELLYILSKCYKEIIITKPNTSRMANSEKYVICKGFIGITIANINILYKAVDVFEEEFPFSLVDGGIEQEFINLIMEYNNNYIKTQIDNINNTLKPVIHEDYILQIKSAYSWCNKYEISINKYNKYNKII